MPWSFKSSSPQMKVETGQDYLMDFTFTNTTDKPMIGQAVQVFLLVGEQGIFIKQNVFCFEQQFLAAGNLLRFLLSLLSILNYPMIFLRWLWGILYLM